MYYKCALNTLLKALSIGKRYHNKIPILGKKVLLSCKTHVLFSSEPDSVPMRARTRSLQDAIYSVYFSSEISYPKAKNNHFINMHLTYKWLCCLLLHKEKKDQRRELSSLGPQMGLGNVLGAQFISGFEAGDEIHQYIPETAYGAQEQYPHANSCY